MRNLDSGSEISRKDSKKKRYRVLFKGIVQGVGFRPFIYRLAKKYHLTGFVKNTSQGVVLEAEGKRFKTFFKYILKNTPPLSTIEDYEILELPPRFTDKFDIAVSEKTDFNDLLTSPDIAVCNNCKRELSHPENRRCGYPFINCTDCGPRFSIIKDLPYDRSKTTMESFVMCNLCKNEYINPLDRRYHAQPISCFKCGPSFLLDGKLKRDMHVAVKIVSQELKQGKIVAIKGLGGYHLACKATLKKSILRLRKFKRREQKPFAIMGTLEMIRENCSISKKEEEVLQSTSAPILLLKKKKGAVISEYVCPGQNYIGFMLPYTPLHLLLVENVGEPLVMTSANFSDEPIIYKNEMEKLEKLSDIVLSHNREIHTFADDSVAQVFENQVYMIRRSRGYVPLPLDLSFNSSKTILALGAMLKTTFTFIHNNKAFISQYIGNTDSPTAVEAESFAISHFMKLFSLSPDIVVVDKHPGYPNRIIAEDFRNAKMVEIQHHKAHVGSLLAERNEMDKIIGVSMDGTGYGDDGNIWGGEFFVGSHKNLSRFGHLKYLFLPSGDKSIKEPWRFALSVLHSLYGSSEYAEKFAGDFGGKGRFLLEVIEKRISGVLTSSCGRLFDAVATICGIGNFSSFEGELPMILQAHAEKSPNINGSYDFSIEKENNKFILNFLPTIHDIRQDKKDIRQKAFMFHKTLAKSFVKMAELARDEFNINKVGLTGGVFQNILLLKMTKKLLKEKEFEVLVHSEIPPNDGGISLGQALLAAGKH